MSDELNHASIIDGIRLCPARRYRYRNRDMGHLEELLQEASDARRRLIATDGVFSMDGYFAPLGDICELAERYDAMVMVDDSHAVGFVGEHGRGTPELHGVSDRVDIVTGTLGKALGGASGGYTSGRKEIVELLRQRSRPYLFSNSVAPAIAAASLVVLDILDESDDLRARLRENTALFRATMTGLGFDVLAGRAPDRPGHARRRRPGGAHGRGALEKGRVRHRLQLPGRPDGKGAHPRCRCRPPTAARTSSVPWPPLPRRAPSWPERPAPCTTRPRRPRPRDTPTGRAMTPRPCTPILDEAIICHVAFVADEQPPGAADALCPRRLRRCSSTPRPAPRWRGSRPASEGIDVALEATVLDALVLARSAFNHSANYRSVVVHGTASLVRDAEVKETVLEALLEKLVPGRSGAVRGPTESELRQTAVLVLPLAQVSAKIRSGPPVDEPEDLSLGHWAGHLAGVAWCAGCPRPHPT